MIKTESQALAFKASSFAPYQLFEHYYHTKILFNRFLIYDKREATSSYKYLHAGWGILLVVSKETIFG